MRLVVVVIAALLTLGLAAFVAVQKAASPASLVALAAHVISPTPATTAASAPAASAIACPARLVSHTGDRHGWQ